MRQTRLDPDYKVLLFHSGARCSNGMTAGAITKALVEAGYLSEATEVLGMLVHVITDKGRAAITQETIDE